MEKQADRAIKGARITGDARVRASQEVRQRYEAGESIRVIAESMGRSYGWVHRMVVESGTERRGRGGPNRRARVTAA